MGVCLCGGDVVGSGLVGNGVSFGGHRYYFLCIHYILLGVLVIFKLPAPFGNVHLLSLQTTANEKNLSCTHI